MKLVYVVVGFVGVINKNLFSVNAVVWLEVTYLRPLIKQDRSLIIVVKHKQEGEVWTVCVWGEEPPVT